MAAGAKQGRIYVRNRSKIGPGSAGTYFCKKCEHTIYIIWPLRLGFLLFFIPWPGPGLSNDGGLLRHIHSYEHTFHQGGLEGRLMHQGPLSKHGRALRLENCIVRGQVRCGLLTFAWSREGWPRTLGPDCEGFATRSLHCLINSFRFPGFLL